MHISPNFSHWAKPMPSGTRSLGFSNSRMRPSPRHGNVCRIISLHAPTLAWMSGSSSKALSWVDSLSQEAHKLIEKMASNQRWDEERNLRCTHKVHQLEEVDMLTSKNDLLMKRLENPGIDHLKIVDAQVLCEECREMGHMGINYPTVPQDVNFIGNSNNGFILIKDSMLDGTNPVSYSTTANKVVWGRIST
jgi:hypothetical protein